MQQFIWDTSSLKAALPNCTIHGRCVGNGISIDSRTAFSYDIFAALKGEHTDGHYHLAAAFKAGASCALVEHIPQEFNKTGNFILVPSVHEALKAMGIFNRSRSKATIIAVTGSVGKTSTKEALRTVYSSHGPSFCNRGNFNNDLGVPISLASMPLTSKYAIFELGMNHKGEIATLTTMVRPHLALITSIANTHIEYFSSVEEIAKAKAEIFLSMEPSGIAIINGDTPYYDLLANAARAVGIKKIYSFGKQSSNDCYIIDYRAKKFIDEHNEVKANIFGREVSYAIRAHGFHQALNSIAALAAAFALGIDLEAATQALLSFTNLDGRGKVFELKIKGKKIRIIDDSYNASPASVREALQMVHDMDDNFITRKVAVLGDMYELGTISADEHVALLEPFKNSGIDKLVAIGPLMKNLFELLPLQQRLEYFDNFQKAQDHIENLIEDGDCILLKGSYGTKVYEIVKQLQALAF